jgi:thioredoxin 1
MAKIGKVAVVVALAVAVVAVMACKKGSGLASVPPSKVSTAAGLPRLVDLGSTTCIPCKMMAPILEDLRKECAGRMQVDFIDVNQNPDAAKPFGIKLIPTQVFFDASGKELWRHEGFISKDDILAKWKELGVDLPASPATSQPASTSIPVKSGST